MQLLISFIVDERIFAPPVFTAAELETIATRILDIC